MARLTATPWRAVLRGCALTLLAATTVHADPIERPAQPWLTGDWGGLRTRLFERGVDFQLSHTSETAYNLSGGTMNLVDYTDQVAVGFTLDLERLFGLHDARLQVTYTERAGRNLVDDAQLGTLQLVQEVYGRGQTVRLTEMSFEQGYFADRLSWKVGRMPIGSDFADFPCDFQNLTFCGSPPGNLVGDYIFNWPISQWGTRLKAKLAGSGYVAAGVYDQNDQYLGYADKLWPVFYPGSTGVLVPVEVAWLPAFDGGRLDGSYKIGGWYSSSAANDVALGVRQQGRYGGYFVFQQQVTRNQSEDPRGGLRLFAKAVFADAVTSTNDRQIAVGAWYTGPFRSRPHDMISFAAGTTHANSRLVEAAPGQKSAEYVLELDYTLVPLTGVAIRPNIQYIASTGGSANNREVWILGLKTVVNF